VQAVTGIKMPIFPKRRFQHGAVARRRSEHLFPARESDYRRAFHALYE
jgi:asparagine synthase (glutamine-hydrolysing)